MFDESTVNAGQEGNVDLQEELEVVEQEVEQPEPQEAEVDGQDAESAEGEVAKPKQSKEANSEFANVRREAEARAREKAIQETNKRIAEIYADYGISSIDELETAIKAQRREEEAETLRVKGYTDSEVDEILEAREIKRQMKEVEAKEQEAKKMQSMVTEFAQFFPDVPLSTLPDEVVNDVANGADLTKAYLLYQQKNIGNIKAQAQQEAIKALKENSETSTGSLNGTTQEQNSMTNDQVNKMLESMSAKERTKWIDSNYHNLEKWGYFKNF